MSLPDLQRSMAYNRSTMTLNQRGNLSECDSEASTLPIDFQNVHLAGSRAEKSRNAPKRLQISTPITPLVASSTASTPKGASTKVNSASPISQLLIAASSRLGFSVARPLDQESLSSLPQYINTFNLPDTGETMNNKNTIVVTCSDMTSSSDEADSTHHRRFPNIIVVNEPSASPSRCASSQPSADEGGEGGQNAPSNMFLQLPERFVQCMTPVVNAPASPAASFLRQVCSRLSVSTASSGESAKLLLSPALEGAKVPDAELSAVFQEKFEDMRKAQEKKKNSDDESLSDSDEDGNQNEESFREEAVETPVLKSPEHPTNLTCFENFKFQLRTATIGPQIFGSYYGTNSLPGVIPWVFFDYLCDLIYLVQSAAFNPLGGRCIDATTNAIPVVFVFRHENQLRHTDVASTGQVEDIVRSTTATKSSYRRKMDAALYFLKRLNVPHSMQEKIRTWFNYNWEQQKAIDETSLLEVLPTKLKTDLAINVHYTTLCKVTLFQDCDKTLISNLVLKLKPALFLPGDYVCRKGEVGTEMYIVKTGQVEVVGGENNSIIFATLGEGSVFGEIRKILLQNKKKNEQIAANQKKQQDGADFESSSDEDDNQNRRTPKLLQTVLQAVQLHTPHSRLFNILKVDNSNNVGNEPESNEKPQTNENEQPSAASSVKPVIAISPPHDEANELPTNMDTHSNSDTRSLAASVISRMSEESISLPSDSDDEDCWRKDRTPLPTIVQHGIDDITRLPDELRRAGLHNNLPDSASSGATSNSTRRNSLWSIFKRKNKTAPIHQ